MSTYTLRFIEDGRIATASLCAEDDAQAIQTTRFEAMAYQEDYPLSEKVFTVQLETADGHLLVDRELSYRQEVGELC